MNRISFAFCAAAALAGGWAGMAAAANPELTARINAVESEEAKSAALGIEDLDIGVRLHGGTAETVVTARFRNGGDERLEGRFALQMPPGSVVTGYALDVGGQMVEGVLVDQIEARRAYESRVRQRIDPGLGEVSRGFQFSTRVYPIEAKGTRTVRVRFVTPADPATGYALPLANGASIGRLSLSAEASGTSEPPRLSLPGGRAAEWSRTEGGWRASWTGTQAALEGDLKLAPGARSAPLLAGRDSAAQGWFEIADSAPAAGSAPFKPRSVAILWDRSLSRGDDLLREEIGLVEAWLDKVEPDSIELLLFDGGGVERVRATGRADLLRRLRALTYRGATSIEAVAAAPVRADACLLFTDGLVTLGKRPALRAECPLTAVSSAADADRAWLGSLARGAGGEAVQLTKGNHAATLARLTRPGVRVAEVRSATGERIDFVQLDAPAGGWRLVGPLPATGSVLVRLAGLSGGAGERVYSPTGAAADYAPAEGLWAADRLAVRAASEEEREALIAFARRHNVAGPHISFLVLETPQDYAESKIDPPAGYPAERRARFDALVRQRVENESRKNAARFATLLGRWEAQKAWWATRFDPRARADPDETKGHSESGSLAYEAVPLPSVEPAPPPPAPVVEPGLVGGGGAENADIAVTGTLIKRPNLESVVPVTVIAGDSLNALPQLTATTGGDPAPGAGTAAPLVEAADWAADRPYLVALRAARSRDRERVLAEQQAIHGALPAFWLDVSEYYHRAGDKDEGRRLLLSALELPTRDSETLGIVAERLMRWGDVDTAIALYERMVAVDRQHPHPQRGLALALAKRAARLPKEQARADLARAIAILSNLVLTVNDDAYEGFDIVSLTELNAMIASYRRLGGTEVPLDPRLVANLDLDLRIVLEWKNEQVDVDMWVKEPNGEISSYWNDDTAIGGRLSPETTDGSGPEQYLLRRAPAGGIGVKAEIYSDDPINPNGTARVIARFIRDFGRPNEREEMLEVELLPQKESEDADDSDAVPVGTVRIKR